METEKKKLPAAALACCYTVFAVNGAIALVTGSLMPYIRDSYLLSYAFTGLLVSLHSVGNLVGSFVAGILPIKLGRRRSIVLMSCFLSLAFIMILLSSNHVVLALAFLFTGLTRGSVSNFNNTETNMLLPGQAWAINVLHATFAIGAILAPMLVVLCTQVLGSWKIVCMLFVLFGLVDVIVYAKMPMATDTLPAADKGGNMGFLGERQYWLTTATLFAYLCAEQGVIGWMVTYFKDTGIMSAAFAQTMASILWVLILFGRLFSAWLCSRFDERNILLCMGIGMLVFFLVVINGTTLPVITLGIAGFGFSMAGLYPTAVALAGGVMEKYPLAWSFILTPASFGSILMPAIVGAVAETSGIANGIRTITVAVIACLIMTALNRILGKRRNKAAK